MNLRKKYYILITLLLSLILNYSSFGQTMAYELDLNKKLKQFNYKHWTSSDNLPTNSLLHCYQANDGYIWISGYSGLIRFDGYEFKVFDKKNVPLLKTNVTGRIAEDSKGNIWFTTQESGLVVKSKTGFHSFGLEQGLMHLNRSLYLDDRDIVWSSSPGKGWFSFNGQEFTFIKSDYDLKSIEVRSILGGKNNMIWFGTHGKGLFRYNGSNLIQYSEKQGLNNQWIHALKIDSKGLLWVGTAEGVYRMNHNEFVRIKGIKGAINSIQEDVNGSVWLAGILGLYRITADGTIDFIDNSSGLPHNFINDMCIDFEGNLWLANNKGGLTQVRDGNFINYTKSDGLNGKIVNAVYELDKDELLIAFDNGKLSLIRDGVIKPFIPSKQLEGKRIRHVRKDSKGKYWYSTYAGLLCISNGKEQWYNTKTGFIDSKIRMTYEDKLGNVWVGTRNNGLVRINKDKSYTYYNTDNGLNGHLIMSITEDDNGDIYVGTNDGGLNIISNGKIDQVYNIDNGLLSNIVFNSYHDKDGNIWLAQNGGLCLIQNHVTHCFNSSNGLINDAIFDIVEDDFDNLWLTCNEGVMKVSKHSLMQVVAGADSLINCRLYDHTDGMIERECNATAKSLKMSNGQLVFPTINGISIIDPSVIMFNEYIPPVNINEVKINGSEIENPEVLNIKSGKNRVTISFNSLSYIEPKKNQFKYQLIGYDDEPIESNGERKVSYTNLPAGSYTFKVMASNNDGIWNNKGATLELTIIPRFFETKAFYAIIFTLFFIITFGIYSWRIYYLRRQQKVLELKVDYRTKEIRQKNEELESQKEEIIKQKEKLDERKMQLEEINASKDRMFSIIAHDLRSPLGNFKSLLDHIMVYPEKVDENKRGRILKNMSEIANATFELLENLLFWSRSQMGAITLKPESSNLIETVESVFRTVRSSADKKKIHVSINIEPELMIYADINMIRTVLRNLLMNAVKFTHKNGEISLNAVEKDNMLMIAIKDNGVGISKSNLEKIFNIDEVLTTVGTENEKGSGLGLVICREFIEKNGGRISVESELNKGTQFCITIPISSYSEL